MVGIPSRRVLPFPFGTFHPPVPARFVSPSEKLLANILKKLLYPVRLDILKANSIEPRRPIVGLGLSIGRPQSLHLADVHIETPKPPRLFGFRLSVYPSPQFLQINGRFYHALPASPSGRRIKTQHGPFAPETLLSFIAPTGHSAILLPSAPFPVSAVIGPILLQRFLSGAYRTSPVSVVSLLPCRRQYPAGVNYLFSQSEIVHAVFAAY